MKKIVLALALTGFVSAGVATPALACEGGKCKMEHTDKDGKTKKARKGQKAESCHMTATVDKDGKATAAAPMSCCAKKDAPKAEAAKETKEQR